MRSTTVSKPALAGLPPGNVERLGITSPTTAIERGFFDIFSLLGQWSAGDPERQLGCVVERGVEPVRARMNSVRSTPSGTVPTASAAAANSGRSGMFSAGSWRYAPVLE